MLFSDDALGRLYRPDVVWHLSHMGAFFLATEFSGYEETRVFWRQWMDAWETIDSPVSEWLDTETHTYVWLEQRNRGRASGVEVQMPYAWVVEWDDDLIARVTFFPDRIAARRAAGLPP